MSATTALSRLNGPSCVTALGILAWAAGAGFWSALLFAPVPRESGPLLDTALPVAQNTEAVARWFGGAALRVRVTALGIISAADGRGAALLSIDGGPARAYRVGQQLAPGVVLHEVGPSGVRIDQDGVIESVGLPPARSGRVNGFIPVERR
jgi:hypothetical protein